MPDREGVQNDSHHKGRLDARCWCSGPQIALAKVLTDRLGFRSEQVRAYAMIMLYSTLSTYVYSSARPTVSLFYMETNIGSVHKFASHSYHASSLACGSREVFNNNLYETAGAAGVCEAPSRWTRLIVPGRQGR